jgi:hypothetical protein
MTKKKVKLPNHIHKFRRVNLTRNPDKKDYIVLKCMQPGCVTYIPVALGVGQLAECWICGDPFVIDKKSVGHSKPHCIHCIKRKVKPIVENLSDLVKDI